MDEALERRLGELLLQLKSGNKDALAEIDRIIGKRLRAYANIYYSQKCDVDDAVQSLLCKLFYAVKSFKVNSHAYSWIITIFKNSIISKFERDKLEKDYLKVQYEQQLQSKHDDEYLTNHVFFNEILSKLTDYEREIVKGVIIAGLPYQAVADMLNVPKSTLEYQVQKVKEKIRKM